MTSPETRDTIVWILVNGYTRTEIDALWDDLYPNLVDYRPENLHLKKRGIADNLISPSLVPFPAGVDVAGDNEFHYSYKEVKVNSSRG